MSRRVLLATLVLCAMAGLLVAAPAAPPTDPASAAVITAAEVTAAVARESAGPVADATLRVLRADEGNVGVSVVRRSKVNGVLPPDAIVHDAVTEVYHVIEGRGVLVTGGTIDGVAALPADSPVRRIAGPSSVGKAITGGTRQAVGPGDVVVIPPHTPHGFASLATDRIVYLIVRVDPHRVLETK